MAGKQHVMAGGQAAENVVLDHIVGFVFKEQVAFVLVYVHPQRTNLLLFEGIDGGGGVDQGTAAGVNHHHAVLHHGKRVRIQQVMVFRR
ncbi:hypothetical protein D3C80_1559460 [compost metagenome]